MLPFVLSELKQTKYIVRMIIIFILILSLYTWMDNFGYQTYKMLGEAFGYDVVFKTITLNIIISLLSSFTITISIINYNMNNKRTQGSILATITNGIALLFSGCSSCGITILSAIGISIGLPTILPGAIKFKFLALIFMLLGLVWVLYLIQYNTCKVKLEDNNE